MGLPFLVIVLLLDQLVFKTRVIQSKQFWIVLSVLLLLTAFFDQFLTGLPIVEYNEAKLLGIYIWHAPIEDFMYTVVAVIGLGSVSKHYYD